MMNIKDIRWKQRFQNFEKSLRFLENAMHIPTPDITQKAGMIQFFEICFELSWNLMKDYMEEQGFIDIRFPREVIKKAFETELIYDGHTWLEALKNRNFTAHTYDEEMADKVIIEIENAYYPLLSQLYNRLKTEI
ncbi:MAG: nucleotidyltransferase substrate binding protein [Mangrovibacterium sp.]|nr:nucleotidyltransferase substrate binding protein [Mangrovibacterium sp.]